MSLYLQTELPDGWRVSHAYWDESKAHVVMFRQEPDPETKLRPCVEGDGRTVELAFYAAKTKVEQ